MQNHGDKRFMEDLGKIIFIEVFFRVPSVPLFTFRM